MGQGRHVAAGEGVGDGFVLAWPVLRDEVVGLKLGQLGWCFRLVEWAAPPPMRNCNALWSVYNVKKCPWR